MAEAEAERPAEDEGEAAEVVPATTSAAAAPVDVQTDDWTGTPSRIIAISNQSSLNMSYHICQPVNVDAKVLPPRYLIGAVPAAADIDGAFVTAPSFKAVRTRFAFDRALVGV